VLIAGFGAGEQGVHLRRDEGDGGKDGKGPAQDEAAGILRPHKQDRQDLLRYAARQHGSTHDALWKRKDLQRRMRLQGSWRVVKEALSSQAMLSRENRPRWLDLTQTPANVDVYSSAVDLVDHTGNNTITLIILSPASP